MAYLGTPPKSRVLSSADIATGAVTLDDISFTDQPTSVNVSGAINKHTMRLSDEVVIDGDLNITDNLILSKISDDGNAITLTTDGSTRTITGTGSLEASTLTQTPNASLTGMTGEIGSAVTFPTGHIIQVESTTLTTGYTASNASWTDITGLSVSITPKLSTSKILILASINITASNDHHSRLMRGSTPIAIGTGQASSQGQFTFGYHYNSSATFVETRSMNFLDSPATDSATTYKIQAKGTGTVYVNRSSTDTDSSTYGRSVSTITVMEIAQ